MFTHKANVLVVEDDPPSRRAMKSILSSEGFSPCSGATVMFASGLLSWTQILVLDLMLPDGNGIDLLRRVRVEGLPIQVAVVTATADTELLEEVALLRPDRLFRKPLDVAAFLGWIRGASKSFCPAPIGYLAA